MLVPAAIQVSLDAPAVIGPRRRAMRVRLTAAVAESRRHVPVAQGSRNVDTGSRVGSTESVAEMTPSPDLAGLASPETPDGFSASMVAAASLKAGDTPRLEGENLEHIKTLAEVEASWPPILVHRQTMRVIDGMHRGLCKTAPFPSLAGVMQLQF
jgi:hypothetical protein